MASQHTSDKRGGRREGAGRPRGTSKLYAFRADKDVAAFIDAHANKTDFIRTCIANEMVHRSHDMATQVPEHHAHDVSTQVPESKQPMSIPEGEGASVGKLGRIVPASKVLPIRLPFVDLKIVAGFPIPLTNDELAQDIELLQMLCPHPDSSYLIRVQGDSMIEAGVNSGDILIVDKSQRTPTSKQIAVCELNGEYTVKRVEQRQGQVWLVPANPAYPEIKVEEGDDFSVWGVVTYIIHKPTP